MYKIKRIHHVAYRCHDAQETVQFYQKYLNMDLQLCISEDKVPSTGEPNPYMHVFLDAGNGNVLAFFEVLGLKPMQRDPNTPRWVQHIAFELEDMKQLLEAKEKLEKDGIKVVGVTDHGIFDSIYFFDPNGHRIELSCNKGTEQQLKALKDVSEQMLDEWSKTKEPPRHADWLHKK